MGDDVRLCAPFFCPWDHFVKDLSMEILETKPGSWEVPESSLRINPLFLQKRKLKLKWKYDCHKFPQPGRT